MRNIEITDIEKFEIICQRLKETGKTLTREELDALCKKIIGKSTIELAMCGYNALLNESEVQGGK